MTSAIATTEKLSLFDIQDGLVLMISRYEEAAELRASIDTLPLPEEELAVLRADAQEQLEQTEEALRAYLSEEVLKVDNIAAYIRQCALNADVARKERDRQAARVNAWDGRVDRIKTMVLKIMTRFGRDRFETALNTIRRQKNGGVVSPVIFDPVAVPDRFVRATVVMSVEDLKQLPSFMLQRVQEKSREFDNAAIRKALQAGQEVPGAREGVRGESLRIE